VLGWLSRNKRVTWTLVSDHAHVLGYDGRRLEIGIAPTPLLMRFRQGPHAELIRQALIDVLGVDARVEGVPNPEGGASAPSGGPAPAQAPAAATAAATVARPPEHEAAPPPAASQRGSGGGAAPAPEAGDGGWASAPASPESAPSWASEPPPGQGEVAPAHAGPGGADAEAPTSQLSRLERARKAVEAEGPQAGVQARVADDSAASADDEDIEGLGEVGRPVIERILGGRVIDETQA
jgi:DNA polymerase-3 subunit gamma/tau